MADCTLSNTGQTAASSISYSSIAGVSITGQVSSCAANSTCGNITLTTATAAGNYTGTYTATPNAGTAATRAINMTVASAGAAVLNLSNCTSTNNTTSPTPASSTCTLSNTGPTAVSSISYTAPAGTTASGPTGSCAANSTCGNVTVTTNTAAGNYTGNLTVTPNTGTAAVTGINLTVNTAAGAPTLSLLSCTSNNFTTTPNKASTTCSHKNTGTVAISSISYSTLAGMSTTGPTGACAANTVCGTVVVSTGTTAGNYTGTLSISSVPAASSATNLAIDLTVNGANAETVTYLHTDGLGSPVAKTNASGVRIKQTKYEAYGMTVAGTDKPTIGFTGHYNDSDTELTYMQQRYYDPVAGRFLSEDPVLTDSNTGASFNRYVYANNNPYRFIDPDGRDSAMFYGTNPSYQMSDPCHGDATCSGRVLTTMAVAYGGGIVALARSIIMGAARETFKEATSRGKASEEKVLSEMGLKKNTESVSTAEGKSIPDGMTATKSVEIKDAACVACTKQVRIQTEAAKASGKESVLVTGQKTHVTKPAEKAFDRIIRRDDLGPQK
ncbi:RHS repeat-associated core domain-containing protein [Undibacterium baiyunense]|uniref:Teneurin-like YD-shell domain-containing protein n=1 Tax=Undibacterium baiyunense TaxID=2828731 RepID=A0A941DCC1_9BURK|nr:RHS repeat-associated core domain-containing protein [Undibacterium baiyunense]MBR7745038.1 hypothetical protein [Undibacterium baiyunense]